MTTMMTPTLDTILDTQEAQAQAHETTTGTPTPAPQLTDATHPDTMHELRQLPYLRGFSFDTQFSVAPEDHAPVARVTLTVEIPLPAPRADAGADETAHTAVREVAGWVHAIGVALRHAPSVERVTLPAYCAAPARVEPTVPPHPGASLYEVQVARVVEVTRTIEQTARYTHERTVTVLATSEEAAQAKVDAMSISDLFDELMPRSRDRDELEWQDNSGGIEVVGVEPVEDDEENSTTVESEALDADDIRHAILADPDNLLISEEVMRAMGTVERDAVLSTMLAYAEALLLYEKHVREGDDA